MKTINLIRKVVTLVIMSAVLFNCTSENKKNSVTVAVNVPMTGELAFYGEEISDGVNFAMSLLKEQDDNNYSITYDFQDNNGNAKDAVAVFRKQELKGFDIYISGVTPQTYAILGDVEKTKKPHFIWSFTPLQIKKEDNLFRTWVDMSYEGECYLNYIRDNGFKKVAFIYQNISSTNELFNEIIKPELEKDTVEIVYNEAYSTDTKDFKNIVAKLKASKAEVAILYGFKHQLINLVQNLNEAGVKRDGNILMSFDFLDIVDAMSPDLLDGIVTNVPQYVVTENEKVKNWKQKFEEKYNRVPLFTDAYAYDMANIIYKAVQASSGKNIDLESAIKSVNTEGITGDLKFRENGELFYNVVTVKFVDGKFVTIE